jgi:predicted phage tail protein
MMKKIILHGLLKKMFCDSFIIKSNSLKDIFKCIASNTKDYSFKMNKLLKQQYGLALVIDGVLYHDIEIDLDSYIKTASVIEIFICSGFYFGIGALVASAIAYLSKLTLLQVLKFILFVAIMVGISYLISYLMKPGDPKQIKTASFIFSGRDNVAARNTPIQLGYGRLKVGTSVINAIQFTFDSSYVSSISNIAKIEVGVGNYSSLI